MSEHQKFSKIGLTKETESPENPSGLEKRVAMIPRDVKELVDFGCYVSVEEGAGLGVGFSDKEYLEAGAKIENGKDIYLNKDLVIKFKGPSLENTALMTKGTTLFCMAHFRSFPERAKLMEDCKLNVIAMENILEAPKFIPNEIILSKRFVDEALKQQNMLYQDLHISFLGYNLAMMGGIRRAGNRNAKTHRLYQHDVHLNELEFFGQTALYLYDSRVMKNKALINELETSHCQVFDLCEFEKSRGDYAIKEYQKSHKPFEFGGRRIQCLHETGMAGARYGFTLLEANNPKIFSSDKVFASVLGYGNVGMGAIRECYDQGVREIQILGRTHTREDQIADFIKKSNLIINGAEQPPDLRGKNYLIKSEYVGNLISEGSVVIDLVGGSATNRSPVEDIVECSYLTDPHFVRDGVTFSGLWGWPMMGMMKESATTYSGQILDVLIGREKLINGLNELSAGVKPALVCGPF